MPSSWVGMVWVGSFPRPQSRENREGEGEGEEEESREGGFQDGI